MVAQHGGLVVRNPVHSFLPFRLAGRPKLFPAVSADMALGGSGLCPPVCPNHADPADVRQLQLRRVVFDDRGR